MKRRKRLTRGDPGRRLGIAFLCIIFVLSLFAGRLVQLQGMESGYYRRLAISERTVQVSLPAVRGRILAADNSVLALTVDTYTVVADPPQIPAVQWQQVENTLANDLGTPITTVDNSLRHPTSPQYTKVAVQVSAAIGDQIQQQIDAGQLPGISLEQTYARTYPDGQYAANLVGFTSTVNGNLTGEAGVEAAFDKLLAGRPGSETVQTGIGGEQIPLAGSQVTKAAVPGHDVQLTIYPALQYEAQQACAAEVIKAHASNCSVVIIQPQTGRILAMAQWPTYDPANFASVSQTTDIPLQNSFEPGSTAKVITAAAAFEHGGQTPMSAYNIPYSLARGGDVIHDAEWSPGERFTIAGIIAHSSNVGMSQVAQHISPELQRQYLAAFGLGQPTGLGLAENPGTLIPLNQYWDSLRYTLSFGQGVAVNAVQMASVYATIANGGVRVQPTLIQSDTPAPSRRVIQARTAHELIQILQQVPAFNAAGGQPWGEIPGYAIASKTGTSQETAPGCKGLCQYGSSYIGMAPGDNPQLVVAVNVQNPRHGGYYGAIVAGPVFYQVMRFALATLKILPDGAVAPHIRLTAP